MSSEARILQFGTIGQLGIELLGAACRNGVTVLPVTLEEADFTRPDDVVAAVKRAGDIDVVVNAAAYTAVDKAETDEALARTINADTVARLAQACAARGVPLIHVSTDYVFDGTKTTPYVETDPINPLGAYGRTKLAGETAIQNATPAHIIIRTAWLYSANGTNFVKTMLRLGAERDELRVVDDQYGSPTSAADLAQAILTIAKRLRSGLPQDGFGVFHFSGMGKTTWCRFAQAILDDARYWATVKAKVIPTDTAGYPTQARRPAYSCMDCGKIGRVYGIDPAPWRDSLRVVLDQLKRQTETGQL